MRKVISTFCVIMFCFSLTACSNNKINESKQTSQKEIPRSDFTQQTYDGDGSNTLTMIDFRITVGNKAFSAKLYDNLTTQALAQKIPLTINMSELNGNEKYYYFTDELPTTPEQPKEVQAGDIMLYGDNCLVVFYKTFSSSYRYTRIGYIEDAESFAQAVGDGDIKVDFDIVTNIRDIQHNEK